MTKDCPQCKEQASLSQSNKFRPFCSERCKLIDLGTWANEEKLISRPLDAEDFYDD
ncbi:DNA gyrase inhibitor YacG [Gammaproteobacteria bacterium]|nr:DNA gyrase inhibitor YacG [Gammaproteobacteria bacterium]MDA8924895.1 DNA gyrase inhibitor YacG [Gammaproteobacteria bacterium]MDA9048755.1 DNA gyrase inhibitor YacG [Gammaproteobacteria bacterium]MDA9154419.1 DNA gyrase inhibitor YacG [Gammaproteobacteria bacterium]MDA9365235.1 DNA gyrase inhibitor YacG [Gammaproteobacteria bacterium]